MIYKIQVVTVSEDGCRETLEIACVERTDLKPETLGLTLAEGKMMLNDLQQIVVERQVSSSLLLKQARPDCGQRRCSKDIGSSIKRFSALRTTDGLTFRRCHICNIRCELLRDRKLYSRVFILQITLVITPPSRGGRVV